MLEPSQVEVAKSWLSVVADEATKLEQAGKPDRTVTEILRLQEDKTIAWKEDNKWDDIMRLLEALPGEGTS